MAGKNGIVLTTELWLGKPWDAHEKYHPLIDGFSKKPSSDLGVPPSSGNPHIYIYRSSSESSGLTSALFNLLSLRIAYDQDENLTSYLRRILLRVHPQSIEVSSMGNLNGILRPRKMRKINFPMFHLGNLTPKWEIYQTSECPSSELNRRCFEKGQNKIGMYYDVFYSIDFITPSVKGFLGT